MQAVILAGGKGRRLRPYTAVFPKPLMPLGDRPILEILIQQLAQQGINDIYIAVGHLAELVMTFFGDGRNLGVRIQYVREDTPLSTAGALGLLDGELQGTFLVLMGDVLTDLRFQDLVRYHHEQQAAATVSLALRKVELDFGLVDIGEDRNVVGWREKPILEYLVSMGIYALDSSVTRTVPRGVQYGFPELVLQLLADERRVRAYVHDGYWLDIGRPQDYETAIQYMEEHPEMFPSAQPNRTAPSD
ncbi:MAG: sugar phosphate nucleotidyltransferase [Candidatus Binatia bacterium]